MSTRWAGLLMCLALGLISSKAAAGPVEILDGVLIDPANPQHMIVTYHYGGGGMFVSHDGGKSFAWLCSAGASTSAVNRNAKAYVGGDGSIYLGLISSLLKGNADGCGFAGVPELDQKYIATVTGDPFDPNRTYLITTTSMADNGLWVSDSGGPFKPMGSTVPHFLDDLTVVKNGDKRRFYETGIVTNATTNEVTYSVRVSDDDGMTWLDTPYDLAQFGPKDMYAEFSIVAVDPTNPSRVVARVWRQMNVDTLVVSDDMGKPGTWKLLAEPTEVDAVTYTPEGVLYFGDDDQVTKALYVVEKAGDAPKMINNVWRPLCLHYDTANKRLLGCSNFYLFGTVDPMSGTLTPMLDLRCAEKFVECPGQMPMAGVCESQAQADFCNLSHWLLAPVCQVYDRGPELARYVQDQSYMCGPGGLAVDKVEGSSPAAAGSGAAGGGSMSGAAGATGSVAGATASPAAGSGSTAMPKAKSSGCAATPIGQRASNPALLGLFVALACAWRARRR